MSTDLNTEEVAAPDECRRNFLILVAGAIGGVAAASALWQLIDSLNPSADTVAARAPVDFNLSPLQPAEQKVVAWRSRPVFVVRRAAEELQMLREKRDTRLLRDPNSAALQQPPYARNWHRSIEPEYLVLVGICTHLGCIPLFKPECDGDVEANWPSGYFCPCHGSKCDLAGRAFAAVPAPYKLPMPSYHFTGETAIRIGENPEGSQFDFSSIEQILLRMLLGVPMTKISSVPTGRVCGR